jgi:large subunit ribosomal protein L24
MAKARVRKGDMVVVVSGKDRDLTTPRRVLQVDPSKNRVLVEGVNVVKRHTRPNPQRNNKGGIVEREAMIHVSNVMPIDPDSKKRTRVATKILEDGTRARIARRSGTMLDA